MGSYNFTGSTKIGKIVAAAAAKHLTPTILELVESPCIVDQTAKLKVSSKRIAWANLQIVVKLVSRPTIFWFIMM